MKKDLRLLKECRKTWEALEPFRRRRRRCVDFSYGRQWGDAWRLPDGRIVDESARWLDSGRSLVTNNLIRRLIKSVIGHYRLLLAGEHSQQQADSTRLSLVPDGVSDALWNVDSHSLEEFLISGCVVNRIDKDLEWSRAEVSNRSPEKVFFHKFMEPDASDCRFLGMLHDFTLTSLLRAFSGGKPDRVRALLEIGGRYGGQGESVPFSASSADFFRPDAEDSCRVIEVWHKVTDSIVRVADPTDGRCFRGEFSEAVVSNIREFNRRREKDGKGGLLSKVEITDCWVETWLAPDGTVLAEKTHLPGTEPPILIQAYPMVDGETHSMVEDLLDQQKYINRLVMLLDDVLSASAKGVVLYPTDQLPDGLTWKDLRKIWSSPSGVLPFKRTSKSVMPQQITGSGSSAGAVEMLRTQLNLFDEIAGLDSGRAAGERAASGAEMLRQRREDALVSMLGVLFGFRMFTERRNDLLRSVCERREKEKKI